MRLKQFLILSLVSMQLVFNAQSTARSYYGEIQFIKKNTKSISLFKTQIILCWVSWKSMRGRIGGGRGDLQTEELIISSRICFVFRFDRNTGGLFFSSWYFVRGLSRTVFKQTHASLSVCLSQLLSPPPPPLSALRLLIEYLCVMRGSSFFCFVKSCV